MGVGDHGFAPDHPLTDDDLDRPIWRQIEVSAAAKANQAEALASDHALPWTGVTDDAPRDQSGDLNDRDIGAGGRAHADCHALVQVRSLIETGV